MSADYDKIDEAVLALMYLTLHDGGRAWKSFDWEATGRLHAKGYIDDPVGKARSVQLTETGLRESEAVIRSAVRSNVDTAPELRRRRRPPAMGACRPRVGANRSSYRALAGTKWGQNRLQCAALEARARCARVSWTYRVGP